MKFILGTKLGMTQIYKGDKIVPVTLIESGSNFVSQVKTMETDGYSAVQIGFGSRKEKNIAKPQKGHIKKISGLKPQFSNPRWLREFRVDKTEMKVGDEIGIDSFVAGEYVNIVAITKGRGCQGVVKRHGFGGGPKSHGQKDRHRAPGSIGSSWPQYVLKGMRMAGRMGGGSITIKNLEIAEIDKDKNLVAVKGAVPGRRGSLIMMSSAGK